MKNDFNPVVLMCTHQRKDVTTQNIHALLKQQVAPKIVLVVSDAGEAGYYRSKFPGVYIEIAPNRPLGTKWQAGAIASKMFTPNPLIITGSDDFLGENFISNTANYLEHGYDFVGLSWFYMQRQNARERVMCRYIRKDWPLGGGRFYSLALLERMGYHIFDTNLNKNLDNYGFETAKRLCPNSYKVIWEPNESPLYITAIKGNWPTMNEYNAILGSKYINILKTEKLCAV